MGSGKISNLDSAAPTYDPTSPDMMYFKQDFTPTSSESTLNVTLRHKLNEITTVVESKGYGNITSITNAGISPHYSDGVLNLSNGQISGRSTQVSEGAGLSFIQTSPTVQTAASVLVNASEKGSFTATMNVGGAQKKISLPDSFTITPERKSTLKINLIKCGAYLGPNQTQWKSFDCYNVGVIDKTLDPFSPEAGNHGAKYQWGAKTNETGRYYSQANDQSNSGTISGWNTTVLPNASWSDTDKTGNDPCLFGYRVPTSAQWNAVINNNTLERTDTSEWTESPTNYSSALYITDPITHVRTLMLPAAGYRDDTDGALNDRGSSGNYWSSTESTSTHAYGLYFSSGTADVSNNLYRANGISVRCISE